MATKSIFKNIVIKDNKTAKSLANALEQAGENQLLDEQTIVSYAYASIEEIHTMFGNESK